MVLSLSLTIADQAVEQPQPEFELFGPPLNQYQLQQEQQQREGQLLQSNKNNNGRWTTEK